MLSEAFTDALDTALAQAREKLDPTAHERFEKGCKLVATEQVSPIPFQAGNWHVQGSADVPYLVVREPAWMCDCPDHHFRQVMCAHIIAAQLWVRATQTSQAACAAVPVAPPVASPAVPLPLPEAPASVNVRITIGGRECQWTLRSHSEDELAERLARLLAKYPIEAPSPARATTGSRDEATPEGWCVRHRTQMRFFPAKGGGKGWWSHRVGEGWCKGK